MNLQLSDILEPTARVFEEENNLSFAYLFGSYARERNNKDSDVDIAVYLKGGLINKRVNSIQRRLFLSIGKIIGTHKLDFHLLNHLPILLKYNIIKVGRLIFLRDKRELVRFKIKTFDEYFDTEWIIERRIALLKKQATKW